MTGLCLQDEDWDVLCLTGRVLLDAGDDLDLVNGLVENLNYFDDLDDDLLLMSIF